MERYLVFILAVFCILIGCESTKSQRPPKNAGLTYDTSQIAILPWIERSYPFRGRGFKQAGLTQRDLEVIDSLFLASVRIYNQGQTSSSVYSEINLIKRNYRRQLVAVENTKGEKIVWMNCFCTPIDDWKTNIVVVHDGGTCCFNFQINPTKKTFSDFFVNGDA